jgi:thiol-disulfide isomerase/thioredoxin
MAALTIAVGLLGLVNLLFLFGVVRRLREQTEILDKLGEQILAGGNKVMLEAGSTVAAFRAETVDGERVGLDDETTLVGVFSPGCSACERQLDAFAGYAAEYPGGRSRTLVVVAGAEADAAPYADRLRQSARVVVEPDGGPVSRALGVSGFPAFALVDGDRVRVSGYEVASLRPEPVAP